MSARQLMLPANRVFDSDGAPEPGAMAFLYQSGTSTPALFYEDVGLTVSLGSHITANEAGRFEPMPYQESTTPFRIVIENAEGAVLDDIDPFYFGQNIYNVSGSITAATRAVLAGLTGTTGSAAILTEAGREGTFYWNSSNMSAAVTLDPQQGLVVPPTSDATGASGAWVRRLKGGKLDPLMFGAAPYDPSAAVDATAGLQAFFNHATNAENCRRYIYDWSGEWMISNTIYACYWDGNEPNVERRFINGTLRVAPLASLPGGVALEKVMEIAGYRQNWKGVLGIHETGAVNQYANTTYTTRRFKKGVHIRAFANSYMGPIAVDGSKRDGLHLEGWEAGFTSGNGVVFAGANSIGCRIDGVTARYCGSMITDASQAPSPLTVTAVSHGRASGSLWTNTEVFTAGTGGFENTDVQRSKLTTSGTTADIEINDLIWGRLELTPAIYGTIAATADVDPRTGTFVWTTGDPTNIDGAGNGLKVGDRYPIFQAGPNVGNEYVITGFSGGSNRTIAVAAREIYNTNIVVTAHAATADATYKQYSPKSWHWVSRVTDATNFVVTPWYPARLNSQVNIVHGAGVRCEGDDLANVSFGTVIGLLCGYSYYTKGNFAPTVDTVLGESCGATLRIGDASYGGGLGTGIKHGHSEGSFLSLVTNGGFGGYVRMPSFFRMEEALSYSPRNTTNDMEPVTPRGFGPVQITNSGGATYDYQYGGARENTSGQTFISNGKIYRNLYYDGSFGNIEVRYDEVEADNFIKNHWAEITVIAATGNTVGSTYTLTLSKKMQAQGWTFDNHHGAGVVYTMPLGNQSHKLRLFYQSVNKRVGIQRSQYFLDTSGDFQAPNNVYIGQYSSGTGFLDGKELVLRNTSGYGLRAAMAGASSALYLENHNGAIFSEFNIRGLPLIFWGDGAAETFRANATGLNMATGKHIQVNGTTIIDGTTSRLTATGMPALTGDVTTAGGALATTIGAGKVTLAMQANMATASVVYRKTAGAGAPEVQTLATLKTDLGLTGTNSGDQTSIVGITGTIAQFNTACTDADFVPTGLATASGLTMGTGKLLGRTTAATGAIEELTTLPAVNFPILTGDVTTAGAALATTIAANAVTYAKFQTVAANALVGNPTGSTATAQAITLAGGLGNSGTTLTINGAVTAATSVAIAGAITSSSGTAGIGYATGAGGAVTQLTSKSTTTPAINKLCGQITMNAAALAAGAKVSFVVSNTSCAATDIPQVVVVSGGTANAYRANVTAVAASSFTVTVENITAGSLSESPVIGFFINKGVTS